MIVKSNMRKAGLYIHIPFCVRKCNYCDFYSLGCGSASSISEYIDALCTQIEREAEQYKGVIIDTIFLGGGTPSLLSPDEFLRLCGCIRANFELSSKLELTIEANPDTITRERLIAWRKGGVSRLSIGLQSADDEELRMLGRIHSYEGFERAYRLARELGFDNISIDLMYALPNQTTQGLEKSLERVCSLSPEHISAYCLKIEPSTPFSKMDLSLPDEDTQYEMYMMLCDYLSSHGYEQYEISNFSKNGRRCMHNLKYWLREEYIGLGPSAHSFFDGIRYSYAPSLDGYLSSIKVGKMPERIPEDTHEPDENEREDEYVMLRLRLSDGVDALEFEREFGKDLFSRYDFDKFIKSGHMKKTGSKIAFTQKGFFVSNYILSSILEYI